MRLALLSVVLIATSLHAAIELPRKQEKWIATTADDFTITSNASERETIGVATNLLRMREAVARVTKLKVRSAVPTSVIVFRNAKSFAPYRDALLQRDGSTYTGLYVGGDDANFILLQADTRTGIDRVVFHELAHSFLRNTAPNAPLWFNEGIAEYYSTFDTRGTKVEIGRAIADHVYLLRERKLIPLEELFAVDSGSPQYDERTRAGVFYAQSWALVHYLLAGDLERREQVPKLLSLLQSGRSPEEAVRGAFGIDVRTLEHELRLYLQQRTFAFLSYTVDELPTVNVAAPQPLAHDEVLYRLGDLLTRAGKPTIADAELHLKEVLTRNDAHAGAYASLGVLYNEKGDQDAAAKAFEQAVRLGTRDASAYLTYGATLLMRRNGTRARPLFEKAVALVPNSARAWAGLGGTYVLIGDDPATGIRALEKSLALERNVDAAFGLAQLYAFEGRRDEAQHLIDTIIAPSGDAVMLAHARDTITMTDIRKALMLMGQDKDEEALAILRAALARAMDPAMKQQILNILAAHENDRLMNAQVDAVNAAIRLANSGKRTEAAAMLDKLLPEIANDELLKWARDVRGKLPKR
jgi:tetratricopeptide (TPR) repeat protein